MYQSPLDKDNWPRDASNPPPEARRSASEGPFPSLGLEQNEEGPHETPETRKPASEGPFPSLGLEQNVTKEGSHEMADVVDSTPTDERRRPQLPPMRPLSQLLDSATKLFTANLHIDGKR